jgi:hypothetical protein
VPKPPAGGQELRRALGSSEFNASFIQIFVDSYFFQERHRSIHPRYKLQMAEGVGDKVPCGCVLQKRFGTRLGGKHRYGIIQDGRAASDFLVRDDSRAVTSLDPAYGWRDDLHRCSFGFQCFL